MQDKEVINILQKQLNFTSKSIAALKIFVDALINANKNHNFISKSSEADIWHRHVLDSAQLVKFIDFSSGSLSDLGSGAGFPGLVLAIFNSNQDFHVKLYEKSPVKRAFLKQIINKYNNTVHSTIEMTPNDAKKRGNRLFVSFNLWKNAKRNNQYPDLAVNDDVRVLLKKEAGKTKGYMPKWSKEVYQITFIQKGDYLINDGKRKVFKFPRTIIEIA